MRSGKDIQEGRDAAVQDEVQWQRTLESLLPEIHPVDREATRIWFGFWPPELSRSLKESRDVQLTIRELELEGGYRLEEKLDSSVRFFYGSLYWAAVKDAVGQLSDPVAQADLFDLIGESKGLASRLSERVGADPSLLVGIGAVALMALRQVGPKCFRTGSEALPTRFKQSPDQVLKRRSQTRGRGIFGFLRTVDRRHTVIFDESRKDARFEIIRGQDVSTAAAADPRDYRSQDPRCIQGPIPFQCRSASCGSCWVGVLGGRERLSEISPFEKKRLKDFGYDSGNLDIESHPPVRLSCQAKCYGDVSLIVPPWNGVLKKSR